MGIWQNIISFKFISFKILFLLNTHPSIILLSIGLYAFKIIHKEKRVGKWSIFHKQNFNRCKDKTSLPKSSPNFQQVTSLIKR